MNGLTWVALAALVSGCGAAEEPASTATAQPAPVPRVGESAGTAEAVADSYKVFPNYASDGLKLANTGLAIDVAGGRLFHARYHFGRSSHIAIRSRTNRPLGRIDVSAHVSHIQGLAWAADSQTIYAWGTVRGLEPYPWHGGVYAVFEFDLSGRLVSKWLTPRVDAYPGALVVTRDVIWLKANGRTVAHGYSRTTHKPVATVELGVRGEGLAWDTSRRQWWTADGAGVHRHAEDGTELEVAAPNPSHTGATEGLAVDGGFVWMSADEGMHGDYPGGNRVYRIAVGE